MGSSFPIKPLGRFARESEPVRRPKEFACFSYDENHNFHLGDRSLRWYYTPEPGADLSRGFDKFVKHDDSIDERLDSLLKTIMHHEQQTGQKIDAQIVTWRGIITKIMTCPFEDRDGFELDATLYQDCIFIAENHAASMEAKKQQAARPWKGPISQDVMSFWGYKFETLATLPAPWGQTSREYIEGRADEVVNNKAQYCSVVRTGIGKTILCLGGEVDAVWDSKPPKQGDPVQWVELKTTAAPRPPAEDRHGRDRANYERKLLKWWAQSFLLGVPRLVVGVRSRDGVLLGTEDLDVAGLPAAVARRGGPTRQWDGNVCINFAAEFLEWLRATIDDEGVWRIRRAAGDPRIHVFRTSEEATGHGLLLPDDFINHRIKLSLPPPPRRQEEDAAEGEEEPVGDGEDGPGGA